MINSRKKSVAVSAPMRLSALIAPSCSLRKRNFVVFYANAAVPQPQQSCGRRFLIGSEWNTAQAREKETAQKRNSLLGGFLSYLGIRALTVVRAFLATILALTSSLAHMRSSFF